MKIFLSYSGENKLLAGRIKRALEEFDDIECFVAHDDIKSGSKWEDKILENLKQADYFMPLQTQELSDSFWCQQEAGIAIALETQIVPLIPDKGGIDPVGFYSRYQGARINIDDLRPSIRRLLIQQEIIEADNVAEELETHLLIFERSNTWAEASENFDTLIKYEDKFSKGQIKRIAQAVVDNNQIRDSYSAQFKIKRFIKKHAQLIPRDQLEQIL